jgi:hypothetical protein
MVAQDVHQKKWNCKDGSVRLERGERVHSESAYHLPYFPTLSPAHPVYPGGGPLGACHSRCAPPSSTYVGSLPPASFPSTLANASSRLFCNSNLAPLSCSFARLTSCCVKCSLSSRPRIISLHLFPARSTCAMADLTAERQHTIVRPEM